MTTPAAEVATRPVDLSEVMLDGPLKNMAQAWAIAKVLAQSSMVPAALRGSPQNCLVTMMLGQELDLTWTQATRGIYVLPNGTPGLRGQLLLALIRKAGHRYTFERTDDSCTCTITRKDEDFKTPYTGTFTLADAQAAGLVHSKDGKLFARSQSGQPLPWEQYRRDMLQWRAVARAAGIGAPEVIYGFDIAGIGDGAAESVAPGPVPVPSTGDAPTGPGQVYTAEIVDDTAQKLAALDAQARAGEPEPVVETEPPPAPPGYDDLDQLLKRCGYHDQAQVDLVSALVHRDVDAITDLSKGEVLIAHDVISKAISGLATIGKRRAALAQIAEAERDAMADANEADLWQSE